jgi:chemotaxis protein methyltransferase CheR
MTGQVADLTDTLDATLFQRIADFALEAAGLSIPDTKRALVTSRLQRRVTATGAASLAAYLDLLQGPDGAAEHAHAVSALTTNVTSFFRESHHFDTLTSVILPELRRRVAAGGRVRIWSAGCSSGEEPYSIAIAVLEAMPDALDHDVRILATDIDSRMVAAARAGRYETARVADLQPEQKSRYFTTSDDPKYCEVAAPLRRLVSVRPLNLVGPWPMRGRFDVIFCRNVVIYFGEDTQKALWPRLEEALHPGGTLFIGHSERLLGGSEKRLTPGGVTTFVKPAGSAGPSKGT